MNIALLMPTMRWWNWRTVREHIAAAQRPDAGMVWCPVLYREELEPLSRSERAPVFQPDGYPAADWIRPLVIPRRSETDEHCNVKLNAALAHLDALGFEGWVGMWSDDNLVPRNLGRRLLAHADKPIIVFSHKRGQRTPAPPPRHFGTDDLIAAPGNMRVGCVSGEQYFVHTSLTKGWRIADGMCADGLWIQRLAAQFPERIAYVPDYFTPFNALEPGRWDADQLREVIEAE